jgi:hypothetical protein
MQPTDHTSIAEAYKEQMIHGRNSGRIISPNPHKRRKEKGAGPMTHIIRKAEHDLRRAVPPRRDVLGHEALLLCLVESASEPKIANLELAVRIHEQVARLEIAV